MLNDIKGNMTALHDYFNLEGVLLEQINTEVEDTLNYVNTLAAMPPSKRTRRYLFGKILQFLFGVNEEAYEDIELLSKNDQWLATNQRKLYQIIVQSSKTIDANQEIMKNKTMEFAYQVQAALRSLDFGEQKLKDDINHLFHYQRASFIIRLIKLIRKYTQSRVLPN